MLHRLNRYEDGSFAEQCVQRRLACPVGDSPAGVEVKSPIAWVASVEETKRMKPTGKVSIPKTPCVLESLKLSVAAANLLQP